MTAIDTTTRRCFTVNEYHRMAEVGILTEDDRVELIDGQAIARSSIVPDYMHYINRSLIIDTVGT